MGARKPTYAQIQSRSEIGIPADDIMVEEGNTDTAPYGLGTYGRVQRAGGRRGDRYRRTQNHKAKAQMIAAYMLEVHHDDVEFDIDRFRVRKWLPEKFKTMKEIALGRLQREKPPGLEPGLEAVAGYDPPG